MFRFKNKKTNPLNRRDPSPGKSPVFSYYNNRPPDVLSSKSSQRLFGKSTRNVSLSQHIRHIPTYIAAFLIIGSMIYATFLDTQPRVVLGHDSTNNSLVRSQAVYQQAIASILSSSIFNRSKLTISTEKIEKQILAKFPEIENTTVSLPIIGRKPVVGLDPAVPTLILNTRSGSYIIGEDGRALIKTADLASSARPSLPLVQDDSGLSVEQGKPALTKENVDFITTIIKQLNVKNITIKTLQLPALVNELRVPIDGKSYFVKFNLNSDALQQVGTYLAVREQLESQNVTPAEYIDVRVDERAYYK